MVEPRPRRADGIPGISKSHRRRRVDWRGCAHRDRRIPDRAGPRKDNVPDIPILTKTPENLGLSPALAIPDLARSVLRLTLWRGSLIAQRCPAVRTIKIIYANRALALRTTRAQFVVATRAEVEPGLYRIRALRAGSLARLSQNEVEKNPQAIRNKNGHQRPKDRAHPSALRVAVDVADE